METALLDVLVEQTSRALTDASASAGNFVDQVQVVIDSAVQIPHKVREQWRDLEQWSQQGQAERAGVMRAGFFYRLGQHLDLMRQVLLHAEQARVLAGKPLPRADELAAGIADLENLRNEVRVGWQGCHPLADSTAGRNAAPLRIDKRGDIFVGQSRVLLDTIVEEFEAGIPLADIVSGYDTVQPSDVYDAIAFYLRHKGEVEAYLRRRDEEAAGLWREIEANQPSKDELKAQIKERWARRKAADASPVE